MSVLARSSRQRAGFDARRTPGWLAPIAPTAAVEIASGRVTVAAIDVAGGRIALSGHASEALAAGAVTPALSGANIAEPEIVGRALRRAFERAGIGIPRRAALVVPDTIARISLLHFDQVPARAADLDQLVRWQLRKSTPFALEEATVEHLVANAGDSDATFAAIVARRDVLAQYEAVVDAAGVHAGIVDLASFNVMNAVFGAGEAPAGDWLLVCLADEGTTVAILRGTDLMFYRHRGAVDQEPLSALVHQTAMYHEDRLGGSAFEKILVAGATLTGGDVERLYRELRDLTGVAAEPVNIGPAVGLDHARSGAGLTDALVAPVGVLIRERVPGRTSRTDGPERAA